MAILYGFLLFAAMLDCRNGKIPNILVGTALFAGFVWYGKDGWEALIWYGIRFIGFGMPFLLLFFARMWGAGDVKCIAVIGALAGWKSAIGIIMLSLILAAIAAMCKMIRYGMLQERILILSRYIERVCRYGKIIPYPANWNDRRITLRMSLFFLAGTILYRIMNMIIR